MNAWLTEDGLAAIEKIGPVRFLADCDGPTLDVVVVCDCDLPLGFYGQRQGKPTSRRTLSDDVAVALLRDRSLAYLVGEGCQVVRDSSTTVSLTRTGVQVFYIQRANYDEALIAAVLAKE